MDIYLFTRSTNRTAIASYACPWARWAGLWFWGGGWMAGKDYFVYFGDDSSFPRHARISLLHQDLPYQEKGVGDGGDHSCVCVTIRWCNVSSPILPPSLPCSQWWNVRKEALEILSRFELETREMLMFRFILSRRFNSCGKGFFGGGFGGWRRCRPSQHTR